MGSKFAGFNIIRFFAWGFIKSKVYTSRRIGDLAELRNRIIDAVQNITPQMLESVLRETIYRFELCGDTDGHHVETKQIAPILCGTYFGINIFFRP
jgi:hypothetical protein